MPIRINLLAEAQAAEELRRKDPVKRAIIMGAGCVVIMAVASLALQSQVIGANREAKSFTDRIGTITNEYSVVMENSARLAEVNLNIRGLDILASERFLYGTFLNAIQKVYVDNVQLIHLRTEQNYSMTEEVRDKNTKKLTKPGTASERITIIVEARDVGPNPGDQVNKFKEALAQNAYFQSLIGDADEIRLVNLSPPQQASDLDRPVVQFTLESKPPEKVRMDIASPSRYGSVPAAKIPAAARPSGPVKL